MGNNLTQQTPDFNEQIGGSPVAFLKCGQKVPMSQRGPILFATLFQSNPLSQDSTYKVVVVHSNGSESFDLITGDTCWMITEKPRKQITAAWHCIDQFDQNAMIIAYNNGSLKVVDFETLQMISKFGDKTLGEISAIISPSKGLAFVGYTSGYVYRFDFENTSNTKLELDRQTNVTAFSWSSKNRSVFIGFSNYIENEMGQRVNFEENPIVVYDQDGNLQELEGMKESWLGLAVIEHRNIVCAISNENSVYIWDFITNFCIMNFSIPHSIMKEPSMASALYTVDDWIIIGFVDGSTLVSGLSFDPASMQFSWNPIKMIQIKHDPQLQNSGLQYINYIYYEQQEDLLLLGSAISRLRIINNFSTALANPASPTLPLFSLESFKPQKKGVSKNKQLPLFSLKDGSENDCEQLDDSICSIDPMDIDSDSRIDDMIKKHEVEELGQDEEEILIK